MLCTPGRRSNVASNAASKGRMMVTTLIPLNPDTDASIYVRCFNGKQPFVIKAQCEEDWLSIS